MLFTSIMILNDTENNDLNEKKTDIRTLIYVIFQIEIVFQRKKKKKVCVP